MAAVVYNGFMFDHSCLRVRLNGVLIEDVQELTGLGNDMEESIFYGNAQEPRGRTRGQVKPKEGSLKVSRSSGNAVRTLLGRGFMNKLFTLTAEYTLEGQPSVTDVYKYCRIKSDENGTSEGTEAASTTFTVSPLRSVPNGMAAV